MKPVEESDDVKELGAYEKQLRGNIDLQALMIDKNKQDIGLVNTMIFI